MYVYKVTCIPTGEYYFGLRYAQRAVSYEEDFWVKYFTSSASIKDRIKMYGASAFMPELLFESNTCSIEELFDIERKYITDHWDDPLLLNRGMHFGSLYTKGKETRAKIYTIKKLLKRVSEIRQASRSNLPVKYEIFETARKCIDILVFKYGKNIPNIKKFILDAETRLSYKSIVAGQKCVFMVRGESVIKVAPMYIDAMTALGYSCGRHPDTIKVIAQKVRHTMRRRQYVHNGLEERFIDIDDVQQYILDGWCHGRLPLIVERIRETSKGRPQKQQARDKISAAQKGRHYYTSPDGSVTKSFCIEDLHLVPHGWIRGNKLLHRVDKIQRSRNANRVKNKESCF